MPQTMTCQPIQPTRQRRTKILAEELLKMRIRRAEGRSIEQVAEMFGRTIREVVAALGREPLESGAHGCGVRQRHADCGAIVTGHCYACLVREGFIYEYPPTAIVDFAPDKRRNAEIIAMIPDRSELLICFRAGPSPGEYLIRTPHWLPRHLVHERPNQGLVKLARRCRN